MRFDEKYWFKNGFFVPIAYFVIGIIYVVGVYISTVVTGKGTFLPFLALFVIPVWPMVIYWDLNWNLTSAYINYGMMIPDILVLIAIIIFILIFVKQYRKTRGYKRPPPTEP